MPTEIFFFQIVQIIVAATLSTLLLRKLNQPNLFAYIIAGILIGPLIIGNINWASIGVPFNFGIKEITPEIKLLSELGAAFLLFSIGIETSVGRLLKSGKALMVGTILQVIGVVLITIILTSFTGLLSFEAALFVGAIVAFSSTMIVIKMLADSKETNTLNGRVMIAILLIQDFLVILFVPLLQNFSQITNPSFFAPIMAKSIVLVIIALLANRFIFPRLFNIASKESELFFLASISTALLFISASYLLEIPISVGAFIGGLAISNLPYNTAIFSRIRALRDFFLTIFFVSLGAELSFAFGNLPLALMIIIFLIIFILKPIVFFIVSLLSGYGSRLGIEVGFSLAQASEFGFIIAGLGLSAGIISNELFSFMVAITAFSMIITPHLMNYSPRFSNFITNKLNKSLKLSKVPLFNKRVDEIRKIPEKRKLNNHIIIIGGGIIGRKLSRKLKIREEVIIVDSDPEVVLQGQKEGLPFVYGTAEDEEVLDRLDLSDSKLIAITMLNHKDSISFVKAIKKASPKSTIFTSASHFYDAEDFYKAKVDYVSLTNLNGINDLYKKITEFNGKNKIFLNEKTKIAHLKYIENESSEEQKYKKRIMS